MKEAAGEANMTVITIVLIAIVLGVGTIIVNNMMRNQGKSSACSSSGGTWQNGACYKSQECTSTTGGKMDCSNAGTLACNETDGEWTCGNAATSSTGDGE